MVKIQEKNGVYMVTVPKDIIMLMNLEKGDDIIFVPDQFGTHATIKKIGSKKDYKGNYKNI